VQLLWAAPAVAVALFAAILTALTFLPHPGRG
jgi:hypothetical protein